MANRGKTWDPEVFCIKDLKEKASKKMPKMYRGTFLVREGRLTEASRLNESRILQRGSHGHDNVSLASVNLDCKMIGPTNTGESIAFTTTRLLLTATVSDPGY
jgi:hypothetical protein